MSTPRPERTLGDWLAEKGVKPSTVLGICYPDALRSMCARGAVPCVLLQKPRSRGCDSTVFKELFGSDHDEDSQVCQELQGLSDNMFTDSLSVEDLQGRASRSADLMRKWSPLILDVYP